MLYSYRCEDCGTYDSRQRLGTEEITCDCGKTAIRVFATCQGSRIHPGGFHGRHWHTMTHYDNDDYIREKYIKIRGRGADFKTVSK